MQAPFVDPRPLYETESPLSTRVGAFGRYLVVEPASRRLFRDVTQAIARHSPIADIGCGVGVPLLPVGPDGPASLTVGGAVFICTEPIRRRSSVGKY